MSKNDLGAFCSLQTLLVVSSPFTALRKCHNSSRCQKFPKGLISELLILAVSRFFFSIVQITQIKDGSLWSLEALNLLRCFLLSFLIRLRLLFFISLFSCVLFTILFKSPSHSLPIVCHNYFSNQHFHLALIKPFIGWMHGPLCPLYFRQNGVEND